MITSSTYTGLPSQPHMEERQINQLPLPIEIIFSCSVCQATISDIYGVSNGNTELDTTSEVDSEIHPAKLWLTECCHMTCNEHLEDGGIPFFAAGVTPRARCPVCVAERGDEEQKNLFGIRSRLEGSLHPDIPRSWFETPPIDLQCNRESLSALRFHYISLIRFATHLLPKYRETVTALKDLEVYVVQQDLTQQKLVLQLGTLKRRATELEHCERELRPWKDREHRIKHYLGIFAEVTRENERLREQLTAMGYAIPVRTYDLTDQAFSTARQRIHQHILVPSDSSKEQQMTPDHFEWSQSSEHPVPRKETASSRTLSGRAEPVENLHTDFTQGRTGRKRRYFDDYTYDDRGRDQMVTHRDEPIDIVIQSLDRVRNIDNRGQDGEVNPGARTFLKNSVVPNTDTSRTYSGPRVKGVLEKSKESDGRRIRNQERPAHSISSTEANHQGACRLTTADLLLRSVPEDIINDFREEGVDQGDLHSSNYNQLIPDNPIDRFANKPETYESSLTNRWSETSGRRDVFCDNQCSTRQFQTGSNRSMQNVLNAQFNVSHSNIFARQSTGPAPYKQFFSSPIRRERSILQRPSSPNMKFTSQKDSVASPFFVKSKRFERNERLTLPSRITTQHDRDEPIYLHMSTDTKTNETSIRMPPPPKPGERNKPSDDLFRFEFDREIDERARTPQIRTPATFLKHPATPVRSEILTGGTPHNIHGLFQRPIIAQSPTTYRESAETHPKSLLFRDFRPNRLVDNATSRTQDISLSLPGISRVLHSRNRANNNPISLMCASRFNSATNNRDRADEPYLPSRTGHIRAAWQDARMSGSGISRLSKESGRDRATTQPASSRRSIRR